MRGKRKVNGGESSGSGRNGMGGYTGERASEMLCYISGEVDGEHLSGPLGREAVMEGGAEGVIRVPTGINAGNKVRGDRGRGGELEGGKGSWVRNGVRRKGGSVVGPRGNRSRRVMEGGKEEKVSCEIAEIPKGVKCEGKKEDLGRVEIGDNWFIAEFVTCCFIVSLVYKSG
jgi:hypothetical protein